MRPFPTFAGALDCMLMITNRTCKKRILVKGERTIGRSAIFTSLGTLAYFSSAPLSTVSTPQQHFSILILLTCYYLRLGNPLKPGPGLGLMSASCTRWINTFLGIFAELFSKPLDQSYPTA